MTDIWPDLLLLCIFKVRDVIEFENENKTREQLEQLINFYPKTFIDKILLWYDRYFGFLWE